MSIVSPPLPARTAKPGGARPALARGSWALADQGVVSLGTFLTHVLLARSLPAAEYGVFVLLYGALLFLNNVHGALVAYPLSVKGAPAGEDALRRVAGGALLLTAALALPLSLGVLAAGWLLGRLDLVSWAVAALLFAQSQETLRRALMAHLRYRTALGGDALSYLGQVVVLALLAAEGRLTLPSAFAALALTSAAAAVLQGFQLRPVPPVPAEAMRSAGDFWGLGRWALLANLASVFTLQAFPWVLALAHGPAAAAALQGVANVLGVSHPILFTIRNLTVPAVARAHAGGGTAAPRRVALRYGVRGGLLLLPYYAALTVAPQAALRLFYGTSSSYLGLGGALRLMVLVYLFHLLLTVAGGLLDGLGQSRLTFLAQLTGAAVALTLALPLAAWGGLTAALLGMVVVAASWAGVCLFLLARVEASEPRGVLSPPARV